MNQNRSSIKTEVGNDLVFVMFKDNKILQQDQIAHIEQQIMPVIDDLGSRKLILNFTNIEFMSSSFLGLLVKVHKRLSDKGLSLEICNIKPEIYKVFKITQLDKVFDIS